MEIKDGGHTKTVSACAGFAPQNRYVSAARKRVFVSTRCPVSGGVSSICSRSSVERSRTKAASKTSPSNPTEKPSVKPVSEIRPGSGTAICVARCVVDA